ncbi:small kinetochore-associated protein isoform X3 [Petaurus breviceps papuanus]|uniref:small kinetochore-associated protein isoform X3 n=1 Tax=Petaurus breviceps papuanus TaxID=3040969 RepID=UPI0036DAD20D
MESGSRLGAGDLASAVERPGVQPGRTSRASTARSAFPGSAPSATLGGGPPVETHSRAASKSQIPQRCKEVELHKCLSSAGLENELYKTTKQRQMKTMDPAAKKNIKKSYTPLNRQKAEEELKEKNQLLEAVNRQLYLKLTESQLLLESLKDELKLFNQTATKQMEELQALKVKLKMEEEERTGFLEKRAAFHNKRDDFTAILEQMEQLLSL